MKRFFKDMVGGIVLFGTIFAMMIMAGYIESTYNMNGIILHKEANILTIEDSRGEMWEYEAESFSEGDEVKITFFDNHTYKPYDDEIVKISILKNHK